MRKTLLFIGLLGSSVAWAQLPGNVPTQNLVAWYGFNGDYQDASGANNHLTPMNTANRTTDRFGNPNSAFAASTAGYLTNTAPSFTLSPTQPFSFSLWVSRSSGTVALMIGDNTTNNFITNFQMGTTASQFGTNKQQSTWIWAQSNVATTNWDHYVCVYEAPGMIMYKNGVQVATNTFTHTGAISANLPLWIGRGISGGNFVGSIDEIGIWTRALTIGEVQQLFAGCSAGFSAEPTGGTFNRGASVNLTAPRINPSTNSQWQMNTGSGFTNITASARFAGVNSDTLRITGVDFDLDLASFRCINADTSCADTTRTVVLDVQCNTMLENQPLATSARMQESATFRVSSFDPQASFQWQVNGGGGFVNLTDGPDVQGATNDTLRLLNVSLSQNGNIYRCIINRAPCSDTSTVAILTVINTTSVGELNGLNWKVYPNPTTTTWQVLVPETTEPLSWQLLNAQGQRLAAGTWTAGHQQLEAAQLPAGIYWLQVPGQGQMRLVKQ